MELRVPLHHKCQPLVLSGGGLRSPAAVLGSLLKLPQLVSSDPVSDLNFQNCLLLLEEELCMVSLLFKKLGELQNFFS